MRVQEVLQALEVTLLGKDDAGIHHDRFQDHSGDLARVLLEHAGDRSKVVERSDERQGHDRLGDAGVRWNARRPVGGSDLGGVGRDGDLHRVVVPVVTALDLDDEVASGDRPHQVDRFHRRLGPRVAKAPQGLAEAGSELLRDDNRVLRRLREVRAPGDLGSHRLHDRGMGVPSEASTVAAVEIDVLGPVHVVDLRA